ncbi:Uncharacterized protein BM_BM9884 [Brugia malayi]|uniref:Bm9884 n=1 Tax=Brugia malayi TaxID=6279 RepID=A0A0J9XV70_BRUMA|nr:Uncharacterized protein BM_BM9884 [Brugia malayi]CDP95815.1 Bm9884 [Brugia malayi]VIO91032.1 Uncharacterized protein BM_BM9884 [Brugia malayi]
MSKRRTIYPNGHLQRPLQGVNNAINYLRDSANNNFFVLVRRKSGNAWAICCSNCFRSTPKKGLLLAAEVLDSLIMLIA